MSLVDRSQIAGQIGPLQEEVIATIRNRGGEATMEALANVLDRHSYKGKPSSTLRNSVGALVRRGILEKEKRDGEWWYAETETPVQWAFR